MLSSVLFTDIISVILFHTDSAMAICFNCHSTVIALHCRCEFCFWNVIWCKLQKTYSVSDIFFQYYVKNMSSEHLTVFAGLNQVSASLNWFKPHVWQKQVFAGRNPTLSWTAVKRLTEDDDRKEGVVVVHVTDTDIVDGYRNNHRYMSIANIYESLRS